MWIRDNSASARLTKGLSCFLSRATYLTRVEISLLLGRWCVLRRLRERRTAAGAPLCLGLRRICIRIKLFGTGIRGARNFGIFTQATCSQVRTCKIWMKYDVLYVIRNDDSYSRNLLINIQWHDLIVSGVPQYIHLFNNVAEILLSLKGRLYIHSQVFEQSEATFQKFTAVILEISVRWFFYLFVSSYRKIFPDIERILNEYKIIWYKKINTNINVRSWERKVDGRFAYSMRSDWTVITPYRYVETWNKREVAGYRAPAGHRIERREKESS